MHVSVTRYKAYTRDNVHTLPQYQRLSPELQFDIQVVSAVLPFRVNSYVVDELIDWRHVPEDPMYQLTFPQRGMLAARDYAEVAALIKKDAPKDKVQAVVNKIRLRLNPHPAGQIQYNVPVLDDKPVPGVQHKYHETVLFFPSAGQTCHAYCSYCFRWAQFVGLEDLKFAAREAGQLVEYLKRHPEVTDVLFTGGDPGIMKTRVMERYIEPLLTPELSHIHTIRIGTKALAYWPQRFVTDDDADDLLRLLERVIASGRHVAIMAHFSLPRELNTPVAQEAIRRLRDIGCEIRMQAPVVRHVNDDSNRWARLWREGVRLGMVPYYMFVIRDTGAKNYYDMTLGDALHIFQGAYRKLSGLGRTVRGPVMSATPGKVLIHGIANVDGHRAFVLSFIQARHADWVGRPFFAQYDLSATWFYDLKPLPGRTWFFTETPSPAHTAAD